MISIEKWTTIRTLKEEGYSIRAIAKTLGISRNTVRKALKQDSVPIYKRNEKEDKLIAPYAKSIDDFLKKGFIGTRIFKELQKIGFDGSLSTVYRYINLKKKEIPKKTTIRFETLPGEQAQFDWSPYKVLIGGESIQVYAFLLILSYSRKKYLTFSKSQTYEAVLEALEEGLRYFGGVPNQIVIDNGKQMIIKHYKDDEVIYHPRFLELAGVYRFQPYACQTYWPRTKGKVERPFYYIEQHFIKGNEFSSFEELLEKGQTFIDEWELEPNKTTLVPPSIRFMEERECLRPLPTILYSTSLKETRKVSWDCLISYKGVKYSVPHHYAGKQIWIRIRHGHILELFTNKGEWIDEHKITKNKGQTVTKEQHYEGLKGSIPKSLPKIRELFIQTFPAGVRYVTLLQEEVKANHLHRFQKILELRHYYEDELINLAIEQAIYYRRTEIDFVPNILKSSPRKLPEMKAAEPIPQVKTETRSLSYYSQLLH